MRMMATTAVVLAMLGVLAAVGRAQDEPAASGDADLAQILRRVEARYDVTGFAAEFVQASTLQAMQITDTATGSLMVKRPDRMRWEYVTPDPQIIVTDGVRLWIYRPADNQLLTGAAPAFLGDGRGAGFLADITAIREHFDISLAPPTDPQHHRLNLLPREPTPELAVVQLQVRSDSGAVTAVTTTNAYGDVTEIRFSNLRFSPPLDDRLFELSVPAGVERQRITP